MEVTMLDVSIADAHNRLSALLKKVQKSPIRLTNRGKPVGVLLSLEEYDGLRRAKAFLQLVTISREIGEGPSADEIYRASRQELEERS
jgi:prevent-host-death family protein